MVVLWWSCVLVMMFFYARDTKIRTSTVENEKQQKYEILSMIDEINKVGNINWNWIERNKWRY